MQDSLEDYIRLANNVEPNTLRTVRCTNSEKENTFITDARALKIVEFAIDGQLRPEVFLKCLNYINATFYQDIVEERRLSQYCGYPICGYKILDGFKKQYFISTKANKVYDITERKNFCSNFCYKASNHIKQQIESTPLWLRTEHDCPNFQLLLPSAGGISGEELLTKNKNSDESEFTSVSDFAEASLCEAQECERTTEFKKLVTDNKINKEDELVAPKKSNLINKYTIGSKNKDMSDKAHVTITEKDRRSDLVKEVKTEVVENCKSLDKRLKMALEKVKRMKEDGTKKKLLIEMPKTEALQSEPMEKSEGNSSKEDFQLSKHGVKITNSIEEIGNHLPNIDNIFHCFTIWTTLDTFLFLHGEERIRAALTERKLTILFDHLRVSALSIEQQVRCRHIYRRLHMQDIAENRRDNVVMDDKKGSGRKPLPEYAELKKESKDLTVKVKAFLRGMPYDTEPLMVKENICACEEKVEVNRQIPAVLPLLDNSSRSAIRRRIFLNSAIPQVRKHLFALNMEENLIDQIQHLVHTFQLSAKNIVFKPKEWKLIGIVLLEILSTRNKDLQISLTSELYNNYIRSEFSSIVDFNDYIVGVKNYLQNVELFIALYISSDK